MKKIAIIGGGISALACAVSLKEKGLDFTVLKRKSRPGENSSRKKSAILP